MSLPELFYACLHFTYFFLDFLLTLLDTIYLLQMTDLTLSRIHHMQLRIQTTKILKMQAI